jgi:cis-3-alkyl-4-acyloxetan-2-one decarboxylase
VPREPDLTFGGTWPYEPRWLETDGVRLHYVDEGPRDGEPVLMLHGQPTWSYLYRRFIPPLVDAGYRAIAYDQLGYGRSDKPDDLGAYSIERHIRHLDALVDELELRDVTLVVHDWGGPIGLGWAVDNADRLKRLVVFNTGTGHVPEGARTPWFSRLVRTPYLGDVLTRGFNVFTTLGLERLSRLDENAKAAYRRPHPGWQQRAAVAAAPRMIPWDRGNPNAERARRTEENLGVLGGKPILICWGMRDPVLRPPLLKHLRGQLGQAEVRELRDASHFVQEDAPDEILGHLLDFLKRTR